MEKIFCSPMKPNKPVARNTSSTCFFSPENTGSTPASRNCPTRFCSISSPDESKKLIASPIIRKNLAVVLSATAVSTASSKCATLAKNKEPSKRMTVTESEVVREGCTRTSRRVPSVKRPKIATRGAMVLYRYRPMDTTTPTMIPLSRCGAASRVTRKVSRATIPSPRFAFQV